MSTTAHDTSRIIDGRYRLHALLGTGGMSEVYEAEHLYTRRRVALKLLRSHVAAKPEAAQLLLREARSAARIVHPHCAQILDMGQEPDGTLYLVEELLDGTDLRRHLGTEGRLAPEAALAIMLPILDALAAAHAQGVIHRDVQPGNIFLARVGEAVVPKLIDFGIATTNEVDAGQPPETLMGLLTGTPAYMAPEQLRGERPLDGRTDIWSVGVVCFEVLVGRRPFQADSLPALVTQILMEPVKHLGAAARDLPPHLRPALLRALEPERERRWAKVEDFRRALLDATEAGFLPAGWNDEPTRINASELPGHEGEEGSEASDGEEAPARWLEPETLTGNLPRAPGLRTASRRGVGILLGLALGLMAFGLLWRCAGSASKQAQLRAGGLPAVPVNTPAAPVPPASSAPATSPEATTPPSEPEMPPSAPAGERRRKLRRRAGSGASTETRGEDALPAPRGANRAPILD